MTTVRRPWDHGSTEWKQREHCSRQRLCQEQFQTIPEAMPREGIAELATVAA
eukprot:CAMPEP_0183440718 /NCGR_PEP_ID=MMETSP0370-20130417/82547_1 /TAXON_ID=268820 /ORGANISM="Peridinium aciculiferum, Strain PAER-2" /LENGTH=51 /DNA_ID=CAMNT_0025629679 /DNA_START=56 /DNA_END=208 /DNA_ORIENTATION=-